LLCLGKPQYDSQQQLIYLFNPANGQMGLRICLVRKHSSGRYGAFKDYRWQGNSLRTRPSFLTGIDCDLLEQLDHQLGDYQAKQRFIEGPGISALLAQLLATKRCYFSAMDQPMKPGASRDAALLWQPDLQGSQHLSLSVATLPANAYCSLDGWYFNVTTRELGLLDFNCTLSQVQALREYSPVAVQDVAPCRQSIMEHWAAESLPLPKVYAIRQLDAIQPTPVLRLTKTEQIAEPSGRAINCALIGFKYHGMEFEHRENPQRFISEQVLLISQDEAFEQRCIEQVMDFNARWMGIAGYHSEMKCQDWMDFQLQVIPKLEAKGWQIVTDPSFDFPLVQIKQLQTKVQVGQKQGQYEVSLQASLEQDDVNLFQLWTEIDGQLWVEERATDTPTIIPLPDGRHLAINSALFALLAEIFSELGKKDIDSKQGTVKLNKIQIARLSEVEQGPAHAAMNWQGPSDICRLTQWLADSKEISNRPPPKRFKAKLRDYQQLGLNWLQILREIGLAGILADDMGLGKTVQALAHIQLERESGRMTQPVLVIAPTSLMVNWRREAETFVPDLRVLTLHGPKRHELFAKIPDYDLVLTTYPLLNRDLEQLQAYEFYLLILDEAQVIKNARAKVSQAARALQAEHRLCMTGTPLENHLGELWSLYDFLLPGFLGSPKNFKAQFRKPIEKWGDEWASERLSRRVQPFLLRRTKEDVLTELPPKTEIVRSVVLEDRQSELYETVRLAMHERVQAELQERGFAQSKIIILEALLKLRQICCDPRLLKMSEAHQVNQSAKLAMLMEMLPEMIEEGRQVLLFSQFTSMLSLIEAELKKASIDFVKLTGRTRDRATPIEQFQQGAVPLFLISLKAGGVGLNLTAADTVIHYDPWWNPAVERQATDRAHRMGQDKPVFVYRLLTEGTVEARIQEMQQRKQALADNLFSQTASTTTPWTEEDVAELFKPL